LRLRFGTVDDAEPAERWYGLSEQIGFLMESAFGSAIEIATYAVLRRRLRHRCPTECRRKCAPMDKRECVTSE